MYKILRIFYIKLPNGCLRRLYHSIFYIFEGKKGQNIKDTKEIKSFLFFTHINDDENFIKKGGNLTYDLHVLINKIINK